MHNLGLDASAVGITLGCYGTGMILGALFASRVIGAMKYGHAVLVGPVVSVISMSAMVLTIWAPLGFLAGFAFFLFGLGPVVWIVTSTTLRQTLTPSPMLGRVTAIFLTVNMGARPFGAAIGGLIGSAWGAPTCLVVALIGFILAGLFIFASPIKDLEHLPQAHS
jgi:predicted MFS family arabinose efflux permease